MMIEHEWIIAMLDLHLLVLSVPLLAATVYAAPELDAIRIQTSTQGIVISSGTVRLTGAGIPVLVWRYPGETAWRQERAPALANIRNTAGAVSFEAVFEVARAQVRADAAGANAWRLSGSLLHRGTRAVELARFHYLDGALAEPSGMLELQGNGDFPRLVRSGEKLPPTRADLEKIWAGMGVFWPRLAEPIADAPNWSLSRDIAIFTTAWNQPGWGFGFTGPGTSFGEIGFHTAGNPTRFFVGVLLDNILFEPGERRTIESALVWHGDWQEGLRQWALETAREFQVKPPKPSLAGYCSWYQLGQAVKPEEILRAAREFAAWPVTPGGRTIQIDDGWQIQPGDWHPNTRFASAYAGLPAQIRTTGAIPGTYVAPTAVHASNRMAREHPEWLQRLPDGRFAVSFSNWGGKTHFVEPDRPEVHAFVRNILDEARSGGWGYVKIDFTYSLSTARVAYDRKKTSFESQRGLYRAFREGAGPDLLLSACVGEPGRYALGLVDIARLGGDIGANWKTVEGNLARVLTLTATNGVWWQGDPDVFYMRAEKSQLTEEESYLLTGTLGLFGGVFLTSDFPSQWTGSRAGAVLEFWTKDGIRRPTAHRALWSPDGRPLAYSVSYEDGRAPRLRVGIYNWTDLTSDLRVTLTELGAEGTAGRFSATGRGEALRLANGAIISPAQPPHSLRIADFE